MLQCRTGFAGQLSVGPNSNLVVRAQEGSRDRPAKIPNRCPGRSQPIRALVLWRGKALGQPALCNKGEEGTHDWPHAPRRYPHAA